MFERSRRRNSPNGSTKAAKKVYLKSMLKKSQSLWLGILMSDSRKTNQVSLIDRNQRVESNTCLTSMYKTSQRLHLFHFRIQYYVLNILIRLNLNESVCVKRQFIFDFTGFNHLRRSYFRLITPERLVLKYFFFALNLFGYEPCCLFPIQSKFISKLRAFQRLCNGAIRMSLTVFFWE